VLHHGRTTDPSRALPRPGRAPPRLALDDGRGHVRDPRTHRAGVPRPLLR
jgi:hypothetical protein